MGDHEMTECWRCAALGGDLEACCHCGARRTDDPDVVELLDAAEAIASRVPIPADDAEEVGVLLIHRNAKESIRSQYPQAHAMPDGTLVEIIDGERLTAFGIPSKGQLRVAVFSRCTCLVTAIPRRTLFGRPSAEEESPS